jgi:hypothetical protein
VFGWPDDGHKPETSLKNFLGQDLNYGILFNISCENNYCGLNLANGPRPCHIKAMVNSTS